MVARAASARPDKEDEMKARMILMAGALLWPTLALAAESAKETWQVHPDGHTVRVVNGKIIGTVVRNGDQLVVYDTNQQVVARRNCIQQIKDAQLRMTKVDICPKVGAKR
jgi:hypothetical protein